jgi:hypothetical protein
MLTHIGDFCVITDHIKDIDFEAMFAKYDLPISRLDEVTIALTEPKLAYEFAKYEMRCRWVEAEPLILENVGIAFLYFSSVVRDKWPEAEPIFKTDGFWYECYVDFFEENEREILDKKRDRLIEIGSITLWFVLAITGLIVSIMSYA